MPEFYNISRHHQLLTNSGSVFSLFTFALALATFKPPKKSVSKNSCYQWGGTWIWLINTLSNSLTPSVQAIRSTEPVHQADPLTIKALYVSQWGNRGCKIARLSCLIRLVEIWPFDRYKPDINLESTISLVLLLGLLNVGLNCHLGPYKLMSLWHKWAQLACLIMSPLITLAVLSANVMLKYKCF